MNTEETLSSSTVRRFVPSSVTSIYIIRIGAIVDLFLFNCKSRTEQLEIVSLSKNIHANGKPEWRGCFYAKLFISLCIFLFLQNDQYSDGSTAHNGTADHDSNNKSDGYVLRGVGIGIVGCGGRAGSVGIVGAACVQRCRADITAAVGVFVAVSA